MPNSADPDQLASNLSESTLFAKDGYIRVQQDKSTSKKELFTGASQ